MESCSPRFAGFGWIWSKEIVSFSDDVILDEISRRGCKIYFTLKLLRNKVACVKKIIRQMIPYTPSFSLWPKKVNRASLVILKVCSSAWLSVSSFSFVTVNDVVMRDILCINVTLNLDCSSHMLLLGIFRYVRNSVSFPCLKKITDRQFFLPFPYRFSRFLSFSSSLFLFSFLPFSFLSFIAHFLNLQNLENKTLHFIADLSLPVMYVWVATNCMTLKAAVIKRKWKERKRQQE